MYLNPNSFGNDFGEMFNRAIDQLRQYGGVLRIEPGLYETATEPTILNFPRSLRIDATGVNLRTVGPISGIRVESDVKGVGHRGTKVIIDGIGIDQSGNLDAVSGIHLDGSWHTKITNCVLTGDGGNGEDWSAVRVNRGPQGLFSLWNKIIDCKIGREFGNGALPFGIRLLDHSNATSIRGNTFGSVNVGIAIDAIDKIQANGVVIDDNTCENGGILAYTGVFVRLSALVPNTKIQGVQISSGRYEKMKCGIEVIKGPGSFDAVSKGLVLFGNQYADTANPVINPTQLKITRLAE